MTSAASIRRQIQSLRENATQFADTIQASVGEREVAYGAAASSFLLGAAVASSIGPHLHTNHSSGNFVTEFLSHRATSQGGFSHRWATSARAVCRGAAVCALGYLGYRAAQTAFDVFYAPDTGPVLETLAEEPDFGIFCPREEPLDGEDLTANEADQLGWELQVAEIFSPADGLGGLNRHSRNLLRYWVERVYEKFPMVRDDEGDRIVVYKRVREWMAAKGYRLEDRAKLADIVVGLAIAGTAYRENTRHIVAAAKRQTWLEWLLRRKAGSQRVME